MYHRLTSNNTCHILINTTSRREITWTKLARLRTAQNAFQPLIAFVGHLESGSFTHAPYLLNRVVEVDFSRTRVVEADFSWARVGEVDLT